MRTGHTREQPAGGTARPTRAWSKVVSARRPAGLSVRRGRWGGARERPTWEAYPDWAPQVRVTSKFSKSPPPAPRPEAVQEREASQGPGSTPGAGQSGPQSARPLMQPQPRRPPPSLWGSGAWMRSASSHLAPVPAPRGPPGWGRADGQAELRWLLPRQLSACPLLWTEGRAPSGSQREGPPPCAPLSQVPPALGALWGPAAAGRRSRRVTGVLRAGLRSAQSPPCARSAARQYSQARQLPRVCR